MILSSQNFIMREVISIHLGQAGVQIGNNCWELYCIEHGLDSSGSVALKNERSKFTDTTSLSSLSSSMGYYGQMSIEGPREEPIEDGFGSFFMESSDGSYTPRAIMADLEPTVVDEVRSGHFKKLYAPGYLISGKEDAANNFARGYYTTGREIVSTVVDSINKLVEGCEKLQGFIFYHSFGGGTGSGFHSLLSNRLTEEYSKISKIEVAVFPSPTMATSVVEPYNTILCNSLLLDTTQCVFLADNEAMYYICQKSLDIDNPSYRNLNRLLAQTVSSITASLRFKGTLNTDFSDFQTNLVPFPKIHFPMMSYAPIISVKASAHEMQSVTAMTNKLFDDSNRLVTCPVENGLYMSCCLLYRGDITPKDVNSALAQTRETKDKEKRNKRAMCQFVDWSPTGFKLGLNSCAPSSFPNPDITPSRRAVCMMCNTTAIKHLWERLNHKFDLMLQKKAFLHWYEGEGMCISEFMEAQESILGLEQEYVLVER